MRVETARSALERPATRIAGRIVGEDEDLLTVRMAGYLVEVPRQSVLGQEEDEGDVVILNLKPDAEVLLTTVAPVEDMIGVLSSRIVRGMINPQTECCDCTECSYCTDCTECSYCTDCTECSYCTQRAWGMRALGRVGRLSRFGRL